MQFGAAIPHYGRQFSSSDLREMVQTAEGLGFHSVWVGDHVITPQGLLPSLGHVFYDAFVTLSQAAAFSRGLRLGTSVVVLPYRSPLVTAKMVATLDALSGGRVILGVGAGNAPDEFEALGVPSNTRGRRTDEYIQAMIAVWTEQPASYEGEFISFRDVHTQPKPLQPPHPPIWVGGHSEAALRRAVRFGEAWHSGGMTVERMAEAAATLRGLSAEAGRANPPEVTTRLAIRLTETEDTSPERREGRGTPEQVAKDLRRYREAGVSLVVCDFGLEFGEAFNAPAERFQREVAPALA